MTLKFAQGEFAMKNPRKYIGGHQPIYRSGWEMAMMQFLDNHASIIQWASEPFPIPYLNPVTGRRANYYPDFFIVYEDRNHQQRSELVEIKPRKQSLIEGKMSSRDAATVAVNHAKWRSASAVCRARGWHFRVVTEAEIFAKSRGK